MNAAMLKAFRVELESIEKSAGFLRDVGTNVGNTLKGFTTPVQSMKKGWQLGGWTQGQEAKAMMEAGQKVGPRGQRWAQGKGIGRKLPGSKSLTLATTALMAPEALKKEDPTGQGRSRKERMGRLVGNVAGGLIGAPYGFSGAIAGGIVGEQAGKYVGKAFNRVTGGKRPAPQSAPPPGYSQPAPQGQPQVAYR